MPGGEEALCKHGELYSTPASWCTGTVAVIFPALGKEGK